MLFDERAHEPLSGDAWSAPAAQAAIRAIAADADAALRGRDWWPLHPLDDDGATPDVVHGVYFGAAGVLLALRRLADAGLHEPRHDYARLAHDALESYLERPELGGPLPSVWLGESGIALVAWLLAPGAALADRIERVVSAAPADETLELLWGSPGLLLVAGEMLERTGERRWADSWSAIARRLFDSRDEREPGLWTQRLYGSEGEILGPPHGFAGIVAGLARHPELVAAEDLAERSTEVLAATAVREDARANWPPERGGALRDGRGEIRTQWCHGAPGIVCSLTALPREQRLDELLLAGGELTWAAGPLRKGPGLCHGTAGNGFALLKLFERTQDERWLERARRFAMHAAAQVEAARREHGRGRYSLWTGDVGAAIMLQRCLHGGADLPALDAW